MHLILILFAILPHIIANGDDPLKDGLCNIETEYDILTIPPKEEFVTLWYLLTTNSQNPKLRNRKCYQWDVVLFEGGYDLETTYKDEDNVRHNFVEKITSVVGTTNMRGQTTNDHVDELPFSGGNGRIYSVVAIEDGVALMFHICKEYGNKHRDYYEVRSQKIVSEEILDKLKKTVRDLGDDREFIDTDNDNCH